MKVFFGIFLILTLVFPLSGAEKEKTTTALSAGKGKRVGLMLLPAALSSREQERIRSARFIARVKDFAAAFGKGRKKRSIPCNIRMVRNFGHVQIQCDNAKSEIVMEEDFSILSSRKENLHFLAGWLLLTENGILPQEVKNREFYSSFLVSGVARRAFMDVDRRSMPYPDYFPGARTLASHGIFPTLSRCLENPGERSWSSSMALYSEFCEILFLALLRGKNFRRESLAGLLDATAFSPERDQKKHLFNLLQMEPGKKKNKRNIPEEKKIAPEVLEEFYSAFLRKLLQGPMQPLSPERWEVCYRQILSFPAPEESRKSWVTLSDPGFPEVFRKLPDVDSRLFHILHSLLRLGNISPQALREELHTLRKNLLHYRYGMKKSDLNKLLESEKRIFQILEREYALREFLDETEKKAFPPVMRFQRSLAASAELEKMEKNNMPERFSALFAGAESALYGKKGGLL